MPGNFQLQIQALPEKDDSVNDLCNMCDDPGGFACGICQSARYCSDNCRALDWHMHQQLCHTFDGIDDRIRPSPEHRLGILFPTQRRSAQFVWLAYDAENRAIRNIKAYLGMGWRNMPLADLWSVSHDIVCEQFVIITSLRACMVASWENWSVYLSMDPFRALPKAGLRISQLRLLGTRLYYNLFLAPSSSFQ
jgi:hypothetical protein